MKRARHYARRSVCLATLLASAPTASVTCNAVNAGGDWNVAATWTDCTGGNGTTANTPGSADTAVIATTATGLGVTVTVAETVANLTINHATSTATSVSLTGVDLTVSTLLTLTSGVIATNAQNLIVTADCPASVSQTTGWVDGNLRLNFATGAITCAFPLGDSTSYAPVSVAKTGTNTGTLTGNVVIGDHTDVSRGRAGINTTKSVNLAWTLTPATLSANTPYGATFTYSAADTDAGVTVGSLILRKKPLNTSTKTPGPWVSATITGTPTATTLVSTGLTTFGICAIGEAQTTAKQAPIVHLRERY